MPPRAVVLFVDVRDLVLSTLSKVVRQERIKTGDRIQTVKHIDPGTTDLFVRKPIGARPPGLQLVLDFIEAKRASNRDQPVYVCTFRHTLKAVIGDHRAHAVADDDVWASAGEIGRASCRERVEVAGGGGVGRRERERTR